MKCLQCQSENPKGAKFCGSCGSQLDTLCPSCGGTNRPGSRFCNECGLALGPVSAFLTPTQLASPTIYTPRHLVEKILVSKSTLQGELKQVTVLFCDIANSTALAESLGPEKMHGLLNSFLEAALAEVHRYEGTVNQFLGDGFMALFGAPLTHEDHVRRALLAALGIQRVVGGVDPADCRRLELPLRIGINTGLVLVGAIGDNLRMDYTAVGDTTNVAARLQQAAEPGTILVSETSNRLAEGSVRVEPVEPLVLKGKTKPIAAYRLLGLSPRRSAFEEGTTPGAGVFVGRNDELALLNNLLRRVKEGSGRAVGIVGEPGIGKSRLLSELRRPLSGRSVTWLEGRCLSYGTAIPYLLVLDLLRSNCGIAETDTPEAISEKVRFSLQEVGMGTDQESSFLLHLLGVKDIGEPSAMLSPGTFKAKIFEILRQLSVKGSSRRPLILALEDLHWIDATSEEFVAFLAESLPGARILLLCTYRPGYGPSWMDKSYASQIPLNPLSRGDSLQVIQSVLRGDRLADQLTDAIIAKADGNPFFLEQLALHAGEEKDFGPAAAVPNTIHDVVMARVDRLHHETKRLLQIAAVIGREFSLRLLRVVCEEPTSLDAHLRELTRLEFLYEHEENEGPAYTFRHALTQEAIYASLLEQHRRTHHATIGHALENLYPGRAEEVAEVLARHFSRSDEIDKAVDYLILAAEKAQRRWANGDALAYFDHALHHLDTMADTKPNRLRRIDAVIKQAEVKFALGQHTEHIRALDSIRSIVDEADDPGRRAAWYYWTGFLYSLTGGRPDVAIEYCREAAAIASAGGLNEIDAFATSCLAQAHIVAGNLRAALEVGQRALSIFETRGNLWWASRTLWILSSAANALGEWEPSLTYCRRALEYGISLKDLRLKTVGWWRMGSAHIQQGDLDRGLQCCDEALALSPIPYDAAMATAVRGYGRIKADRLDAGIEDLREAVAWFEISHLQYVRSLYVLWLAEGHLRRGDRTSARALIDEVLYTSRTTGYLYFESLASSLMADCLAPEAPTAAKDYVDSAIRILERIGARNDLAKALMTRAALRQGAGDIATARELLEEASAIFQRLGTLDEPSRVKAALAALDRRA